MNVPTPKQILWADVCRDGGSYELGYVDDETNEYHLRLPVQRASKGIFRKTEQRIGYLQPTLDSGDRARAETLTWQEASQLEAQLRPLLDANIESGGQARAAEMLRYMRLRGGL